MVDSGSHRACQEGAWVLRTDIPASAVACDVGIYELLP